MSDRNKNGPSLDGLEHIHPSPIPPPNIPTPPVQPISLHTSPTALPPTQPQLQPNGPPITSPPPSLQTPSPSIRRSHTTLSYLIISGGSGANSFASAFGHSPAYVLPVSDDGGSSSEILRCFGGPSIGDIRSRLIRLIPVPEHPTSAQEKEKVAIYNLMAHRFPADAPEKVVRDLWGEIVEGRSALWDGIGEAKRECIRAFLVHFQSLCLRRAHKRFSFRNFSLGNGFLTGARDLFNSLSSAIFLFKAVAGVHEGVQVIPIINTNQTITIAAQLANSSTLIGQCNISHPTPPPTPISTTRPQSTPHGPPASSTTTTVSSTWNSTASARSHLRHGLRRDSRTFDTIDTPLSPMEWSRQSFETIEEGPAPGEGGRGRGLGEDEEWSGGNISYTKGMTEIPLDAKIERLFYINLYGQEIFPEPNPEFIDALGERDVLVYSCGSLWTSIVPCLALRKLAAAIGGSTSLKAKVLLLNSTNDRETPNYNALDYISTLTSTLTHYDHQARLDRKQPLLANRDTSSSNTTISTPGSAEGMTNGLSSSPSPLTESIKWQARHFVTHVVYLEGGGVDLPEKKVQSLGLKLVKVPREVHGAFEGKVPLFNTEVVEWAMNAVMQSL